MRPLPDEVTRAAGAALHVAVTRVADLSFSNRATVVRIAWAGVGTAVAKGHADRSALRNERAALAALSPPIVPRVLASNDEVIVMEDLGDGPSLADVLLGHDPRVAEAALIAWAGTLGQIAGSTVKTHGRDELPPLLTPNVSRLAALASQFGFATSTPRLAYEFATVRDRLTKEPEAVSFVVSDACPDNNRLTPEGVRLFDLESAGWHHAAIEAAYIGAPFCSCWCAARLPAAITRAMRSAYAEAFPLAATRAFQETARLAGAVIALQGLPYIARTAAESPTERVGRGRGPATTLEYLLLRAETLRDDESLPAVAEFAGNLADALRDRHPSLRLPTYPAFTPQMTPADV